MNPVLRLVRSALQPLGIALTRPETLDDLVRDRRQLERMTAFQGFQKALTPDAAARALQLFPLSQGENFQDIFAMLLLQERTGGVFVEFGATNGVAGSNTYLMEKSFGWAGILAEPARCWHDALARNRTATISHKCVWRETGARLPFREAREAGFSTLDALTAKDRHVSRRATANVYDVETITLTQLLLDHKAPAQIDYMSIDTEGSELDILKAFDFGRHRPRILTVEHNHRPDRADMVALMTAQGYVRAPLAVSAYDDWFVCTNLADRLPMIFNKDALRNG
jgi:FkbM family methyltransferase